MCTHGQIITLYTLHKLQFYLPIIPQRRWKKRDWIMTSVTKLRLWWTVCSCLSFYKFQYILTSIISFHVENNFEALAPFYRWENRFRNIGKLVQGHRTLLWWRELPFWCYFCHNRQSLEWIRARRGPSACLLLRMWRLCGYFPHLCCVCIFKSFLLYPSGLRLHVLSNTIGAIYHMKLFKFKLIKMK